MLDNFIIITYSDTVGENRKRGENAIL